MEPFKTEKDIFLALQGYWESTDANIGFEVLGHKFILNGGVSGLNMPGLDNLEGAPLLLKWHENLGKWQIFAESAGWYLVFIDDLSDTTLITSEFNPETSTFLAPVTYLRK